MGRTSCTRPPRRSSPTTRESSPPTSRPERSRSASTRSASSRRRRTDASTGSCSSRLRAWRTSIGGVILYDETIRQSADDGTPFDGGALGEGRHPRHQGRHRRARPGRVPRREDHGGSRRASRAARGVPRPRRALREVARGDHDRRRNPVGRVHPRQRARTRTLRGAVPGGRNRPDRRARGAHGRRQHDRALLRRHVAHAASGRSTS